MTVSLPPLPEGWRDDVVYMLHDFLEDAGLAQTLCALEQETGYVRARSTPTHPPGHPTTQLPGLSIQPAIHPPTRPSAHPPTFATPAHLLSTLP